MSETTLKEIAAQIKRAKNVAIFSHVRPDGDALGSAFALFYALKELGIQSTVYNESETPANLFFALKSEKMEKEVGARHDLFIAVDSADEQRLGVLADAFCQAKRKKITTINLDHHVSNPRFADYNRVVECSANCMNVYRLVLELGVKLTPKIANLLLMGLLTDSGNFSHDDVTAETLEIASALVAAGADVCSLNYHLFKKQSKARAALYAETMSKIRYMHGDRFALIVIPSERLERYGADKSDTEGFVDFPLNVETVEVCASLMEMKKGQYKISLRSKTYADVNKIAAVYGGGGHVRAAGCMLFGELEEIIDKLSYTVSQYLE
ncbi:MAG: bifunctional oligoribonuclease/PAP phosphatase NrnA [Clostridia bacterium]|nr:bifunctional oligoribonuclease/PAP phosphatase NrnA [Clostridia bacterium]